MPSAPVIQPVVLAGGSGTRLWPVSRQHYPKQLHRLITNRTLLQDTVGRALRVAPESKPLVITNDETRFLVAEQLREIGAGVQIVLEPIARNTAPAIALAALSAREDDILLVLASDHAIGDDSGFARSISAGADLAAEGRLVTFGVAPTHPATGYGYIQKGAPLEGGFEVSRFAEKPAADDAQRYITEGYLWNSGMFMFRAGLFLEELKRFNPELHAAVSRAAAGATRDLDFIRIPEEDFAASPAISVDYAVMERTSLAATVPLATSWSDVGSFASLWEVLPHDADGNAVRGDVQLVDTQNSLILSRRRLIGTVGVSDLVIVESDDAILVADRKRSEDMKVLVDLLSREDRPELVAHNRVYRPWGYYEHLDAGGGFQVKRLSVKPRSALSLQSHSKRAEHWVVVHGTATIVRGDETMTLVENQSTYIPIGARHRLANDTDRPLDVIEVQSGSCLGEDDIERFDDDYGRD